MTTDRYRGRRAATIENAQLRVTVLEEGGHIAEIFDKASGVNPLWAPPWPTIEPSALEPADAATYGGGSDARLLAGIMGHNLCLDIFGPPSDEEAQAGLSAHGEGSVAPYELMRAGDSLVARAHFPIAGLEFERRINLGDGVVAIRETLKNVTNIDRAIGWTQHVTLGPPFLERGATEFRSSATRSKVFESTFGADDYLMPAAEFDWPMAPRLKGGTADLRLFTDAERSSAYTAHLMDRKPHRVLRRVFACLPSRRRLCMEASGFSLDGNLGREPQPAAAAMEWADTDPRNGVRRVSHARNATSDDRARTPVRRTVFSDDRRRWHRSG